MKTPPDPDALATEAVPRAMALVEAVHEEGPDAVAKVLRGLDGDQARAPVVTLAAMVDPDRTTSELFAWMKWEPPTPVRRRTQCLATDSIEGHLRAVAEEEGDGWTVDSIRAAHSAFERGVHGDRETHGRRLYQRARGRSKRDTARRIAALQAAS